MAAGLIPAHAGKTAAASSDDSPIEAHPRSRGENRELKQDDTGACGSSPLTRGKLKTAAKAAVDWGLIPAHAGKTRWRSMGISYGAAHPRSRGENHIWGTAAPQRGGSSPLTRGKLVHDRHDGLGPRLIPAHAGKTPGTKFWYRFPAAHPRSRGENGTRRTQAVARSGSSPLTRGKLGLKPAWEPIVGLIPAHAGKTIGVSGFICGPPAHPRSRGEN